MASQLLTAVGLGLDIAGVVVLFVYAPENSPNPQWASFFKLEDGSPERWARDQHRRTKLARCALILLVVGFALQALAIVL